eukprot:gene45130-47872_t
MFAGLWGPSMKYWVENEEAYWGGGDAPRCGDGPCFNTAEMVAYTQHLAAVIRAVDPSRPISSGFSTPRPSAWHQEHDKEDYWAACVRNASVAAVAAEAAAAAGAALYVGEYGGQGPHFTGPSVADQSFPASMLQLQAGAGAGSSFLLSTLWAWECPSHRGDMVCVYPNSTEPKEAGSVRMVGLLRAANAAMANSPE